MPRPLTSRCCVVWSCLVLAVVVATCPAFAAPVARAVTPQVNAAQIAHLSDLAALPLQVRLDELRQALQTRQVAADKQDGFVKAVATMPVSVQAELLTMISDKYARQAGGPSITKYRIDPNIAAIIARLAFAIGCVIPTDNGSPGHVSIVWGKGIGAGDKVYFDGAEQATSYMPAIPPLLPEGLIFTVPPGTAYGNHQVTLHSGVRVTDPFAYPIWAYRGYRGYHGWQFANFGDPTIPWTALRDYFGAGAVEYGDGTHKPSVQSWYNNSYKGMGGGGNCYGMSVSSLRHHNGASMGYWNSWFTNPAHHQPDVWLYPWGTETKQTVQEYQGSWACEELLDVVTNLWTTQSARDVFNRAQSLVASATRKPVLAMAIGNSWWHAVVPYATKVVGDDHQIMVYDNNNPYATNEVDGPDPNIAHVYWASNTFSYGSGNKAVTLSYEEVTPATPHLPGSSYGGPGSATVVAVLPRGTHAQQITDEAGRRFYNADGSVVTDPNSRIPLAIRIYPFDQRALQLDPKVAARLQQAAGDAPEMYAFGQAQGKSLTFDLTGARGTQFRFYSRGLTVEGDGGGAGRIRLANLLTDKRQLELTDPSALQPRRVRVIAALDSGDRVFEARNLRNFGADTLRFLPTADASALEIQGAPTLRFDVGLEGPVGQGAQGANFNGLALQAGARAVISPASWANVVGPLQLRLLGLQNNQLLQQLQIPRGQ